MHSYATSSNERFNVHKWLAFLSVLLALTLNYGFDRLVGSRVVYVSWLLGPSSMLGTWALCYVVYDRWLWRFRLLGRQPLSAIPDLNGTWKGEIVSDTRKPGAQVPAVLNIKQTWSRIRVKFESEGSVSFSRMAMINVVGSLEEGLNYEFSNEPRVSVIVGDAEQTATGMSLALRGTVLLSYSAKKHRLEGDYYTVGYGEQRLGNVCYTRMSKRLLSLDEARDLAPGQGSASAAGSGGGQEPGGSP